PAAGGAAGAMCLSPSPGPGGCGDRRHGKPPRQRQAAARAAPGAEAGEDAIFSLKSPIEQGRPNVPPVGKEGDLMTPLHTMLLCLPAGLAVLIAVCGVAVLWPTPAGATRPHPRQREE